jgi:hypothetical protein
MVDSCGAVIGHKYWGYTAEEFIHVGMGSDPVSCALVHECFDKCVLAVSHYTDKQPAVSDFSGIRIDDVCRITCPVNFDLLSGFSGDVHSSTPFLLIPMDVLAELRIHERNLTRKAAVLAVFDPQKFLGDSIPQ